MESTITAIGAEENTTASTPTIVAPLDASLSASSNYLQLGPVVTAVLLLRDWGKYGLSERVCYHFGLADALIPNSADAIIVREQAAALHAENDDTPTNENDTPVASFDSVCGVASLLECVPTKPWHKLTRREKRDLKLAIRTFNVQAAAAAAAAVSKGNRNSTSCCYSHDPAVLPLPFNPQTRLFFSYEMTRVAFILDASPTLTSTFGETAAGPVCCPMDRFVQMAKTFWTAVHQPILTPTHVWKPEIAVTVLAVYPRAASNSEETKCTSILVRDFRVTDADDAEWLAAKIEEWCLGEVETEIARRLAHHEVSLDAGVLPLYQSSMRDLLDAGQVALSTLSSMARPCTVICTDCRSVACDSIIDIVTETERVDVPIMVLDLSSPTSHYHPSQQQRQQQQQSGPLEPVDSDNFSWLNYDPDGAMFPLHLSDDAEAIYRVCRATSGAFFDQALLHEAATAQAGHVDANSVLSQDLFFGFRRHSIQPNAVQWYTLFSLSPLSPILQDTWGKLPPPDYIARRLALTEQLSDKPGDLHRNSRISSQLSGIATSGTMSSIPLGTVECAAGHASLKPRARTTFSTYFINPIPINEMLLMRVKEGYRVRQYGQSTSEHDRLLIQFTLPLDLGVVIRYELSYKALPGAGTRLVGVANIKIELSGDATFIGMVKNDFLKGPSGRGRPVTLAQQVSARLCTHLRWIRKEDLLLSYLSPLKWSDQLDSPDTPFVRRLGTLSSHQRRRHFSVDEFDCVCIGQMPWDDDDFLSEFRDTDVGSQQLIDAIEEWSTQTIVEGQYYVRQIHPECGVAGYCVVEVVQSPVASRLFTIVLETFGGISAGSRQSLLTSLKTALRPLRAVEVLLKQIGKFLVGEKARRHAGPGQQFYQKVLESHHNHTSWDLVKDAELLPLLMKRRKEIGKFLLLESSDDRAFFAKLYESGTSEEVKDPGNLAQYQLAVLDDKVVVDFHMESEGGAFFPFRKLLSDQSQSKFHQFVRSLKTRDQECGHALKCRTTLLSALTAGKLSGIADTTLSPLSCVRRLLGYASKVLLRLRFFHAGSGASNLILESLTKDMLLSQSFGSKVAQLPIPTDAVVEDLAPGDWFVVEYDKHTMSIVHLSQNDKIEVSAKSGREFTYRELALFTIGVSDLYSRRDDVADDVATDDDHISEHLQVSEFSELVLDAHEQNYSSAAYLSLKSDSPTTVDFFEPDDFAEVIRNLEFVEVARVVLAGEGAGTRDGPCKLTAFLETVLHPIAEEKYCLFYESADESNIFFPLLEDASEADGAKSDGLTGCDDEASIESTRINEAMQTDGNSVGFESTDLDSSPRCLAPAPIFVRFLLDDMPIPAAELANIDKSSTLTALVSVFRTKGVISTNIRKVYPSELQSSHLSAALELSALMSAYVAEQTLERLRHHGSRLQEIDILLAKSCLRKARNIITSIVDVFFYIANSDAIVAASAPEGANMEMEEGFSFLVSELQKFKAVSLRNYTSRDGFLLETIEEASGSLAYWCFLKIYRPMGVVGVEIHHPGGPQKAAGLMESVIEVISACCHRVNQLLLLRMLHSSRTASRLLIPPDWATSPSKAVSEKQIAGVLFHDGLFCCPIVYRTSFELFHRCAANPALVARTLEATVLHIFAVSNRRHVFVYKDESGAVFYMSLLVREGVAEVEANVGTDGDAQIELLVCGVEDPGLSITQQLRKLLQKRLLLIAVDMLSSVLTKNPHYHWRISDISFIRSFQAHWDDLENDKFSDVSSKRRTYAFPLSAFDPGMIILYFRQNICGSTFFHLLSTSEWVSENDCVDEARVDDGNLRFDPTDLVFYYNTSPSKLDPNFQSESTLTAKGAHYARQAGSGIAIVELSLVSGEGKRLREINAAIPADEVRSTLEIAPESLRFREIEGEELQAGAVTDPPAFIQVSITDTALKSDALHQWILLSVNQALIAWNIERHLERMQNGLIRPLSPKATSSTDATVQAKKEEIEKICCGLPTLTGILELARIQPHPAVLNVEYDGVIPSSAVASVALDLLEKGILDQLRSESKSTLVIDKHFRLCIIRSSRWSKPMRVQLERDAQRRVIVRYRSERNDHHCVIQDSPIDWPEYTIIFYSLDYAADNRQINKTTFPKLYEEVAVGYEKSGDKGESAKSLFDFKSQHLPYFRRSFAFIFSMTRNRRSLVAYNWSALLFKRTTIRLQEMESSFLASTGQSVASLQNRCLGSLAPVSGASTKSRPKPKVLRRDSFNRKSNDSSGASTTNVAESDIDDRDRPPGPRPSMHPPMIRRPKLLGKSVEGSAMQAVARSRARASSARYRGGSLPGAVAHQTGVSASGRSPASRKLSRKNSDPSIPAQALETPEEEDRELVEARKEVETSVHRLDLLRQSTIRGIAYQSLTSARWPIKSTQTISLPLAEYIFSVGLMAWNEVSAMLPFPKKLTGAFLFSFGQTLAAWTPDYLVPVPIRSPNQASSSFLLVGKTRNLRNCRGVVVVKLSTSTVILNGMPKMIVSSEGRVLTLPRRAKNHRNADNSQMIIENSSAGLDKLSSDLHAILGLQGKLFDHAASVIERTMKSAAGFQEYGEVLLMLRKLIQSYPLGAVTKSLRSNYKCYEATIVLRSYSDGLIDLFDGPTLFGWLSSNSAKRDLIDCGKRGLCFKREIVVGVTLSMCFLSSDDQNPGKMKLDILCRTQGKDLHEFMFRQGSNIAISILGNIATKAAGLAYKELRFAAVSLQKEKLWALVSSTIHTSHDVPSPAHVTELLNLCSVKPISNLLDNSADSQRFATIYSDAALVDPTSFCACMTRDPAFFHVRDLFQTNGPSSQHLFYLGRENLFLLVKVNMGGAGMQIYLVEQEERPVSEKGTTIAIQKLANFLLHFLWSEALTP